ncbi:hypothetical protein OJF2_05680 [Aquisphaera giovannonii]|uniref:Uncharacterized protein n=1 Tax=Aquisphaera giovannonii TaxID=406548 RepID=A0A5B9VVC4_9BACT|nr:hypothetical protein [Aquisphaera giovannonii]QEH32099.1 hypothetical protein OJF2_05680 [Aquisphaera giovannonii]
MLQLLPASVLSAVVSVLLAAGGHVPPAALVATTAVSSALLAWAVTRRPFIQGVVGEAGVGRRHS